jgi:ankyrin repeat protein
MENNNSIFSNTKIVLFFKAALWDNVELLEDLLHEEVHLVNCLDSWGRSPLHAAAITDSSKCLDLLIKAGANVNAKCGPRGENKVIICCLYFNSK